MSHVCSVDSKIFIEILVARNQRKHTSLLILLCLLMDRRKVAKTNFWQKISNELLSVSRISNSGLTHNTEFCIFLFNQKMLLLLQTRAEEIGIWPIYFLNNCIHITIWCKQVYTSMTSLCCMRVFGTMCFLSFLWCVYFVFYCVLVKYVIYIGILQTIRLTQESCARSRYQG